MTAEAQAPGPLQGLRVLDMTHILAGPYCTMILADLGADVLKVEPPGPGDRARGIGPRAGRSGAYFASVNRGKRSLAIDVGTERGCGLVRDLAGRCDVFVENFRPGRLDRLGLGPGELLARHPRLVYASITGFGRTGPYADRPALDIVVQAMGGLLGVTGEPGGPPVRPGASLGDSVAGLFAAVAILAALHQRERTGRGQWIDLAMLDSQVTLLENAFARYFATGEVPGPMGTRHPAVSPFQAFPTADGYIVAAILPDDTEGWRRFVEIVGREELRRDPRFRDAASRLAHHDQLEAILTEAFRSAPSREWLERLGEAGIPCAPVQRIDEVARDPQVRHRRMLVEIPDGPGRTLTVADTPFRMGEAATGPRGPAPLLGEHTDVVLGELLGLDAEELDRLHEEGILGGREGR